MGDEPKFFITSASGARIALTPAVICRGVVTVDGTTVRLVGASGYTLGEFERESEQAALALGAGLLEFAGAPAAQVAEFKGVRLAGA